MNIRNDKMFIILFGISTVKTAFKKNLNNLKFLFYLLLTYNLRKHDYQQELVFLLVHAVNDNFLYFIF